MEIGRDYEFQICGPILQCKRVGARNRHVLCHLGGCDVELSEEASAHPIIEIRKDHLVLFKFTLPGTHSPGYGEADLASVPASSGGNSVPVQTHNLRKFKDKLKHASGSWERRDESDKDEMHTDNLGKYIKR